MTDTPLAFPKPKRRRKRRSRIVVQKQRFRHQVFRADNHTCRSPWCLGISAAVVAPHHIRLVSQGGPYTIENGITLCAMCHDRVHNGYRRTTRITGRQHMIEILEYHKGKPYFRWQEALDRLKRKERE